MTYHQKHCIRHTMKKTKFLNEKHVKLNEKMENIARIRHTMKNEKLLNEKHINFCTISFCDLT